MRIIRSWPAVIPDHRAHVVDDLERFVMDGYDYRGLADLGEDILLLEWDIAIDQDQLGHFMAHACVDRERPLAATFKLWHSGRPYRLAPHWPAGADSVSSSCNFVGDGELPARAPGEPRIPGKSWPTPAKIGDPTCNCTSFGLIYLPNKLLRAHEAAWGGRISDTSFSVWHYLNVRSDIRLCWDVSPVHLNYDFEWAKDRHETPSPCPP